MRKRVIAVSLAFACSLFWITSTDLLGQGCLQYPNDGSRHYGEVNQVASNGNLTVCAVFFYSNELLIVYDTSHISIQEEVATIDLGCSIEDLALTDDGILYISCGVDGIQKVDLSNPSSPVVYGTIVDTPGCAGELRIGNNALFVADCDGGVRVIDLWTSNEIATISYPANASSVDIDGYRLAIGGGSGSEGLYLYDVSNPMQPALLGMTAFPDELYAVGIDGVRVCALSHPGYFTYMLNTFYAVDPSNILLGSSFPLDYAYDLILYGDLACVYGLDAIEVISVQDPSAPQIVYGHSDPCSDYTDLYLHGSRIYYGMENPSYGCPAERAVDSDRDASSCLGSGIFILDLTIPSAPSGYQLTPLTGNPAALWVRGSYAFVSGYRTSLHVLDVSDPSRILRQWYEYTADNGVAITWANDYIYTISQGPCCGSFLKIYDVKNPRNPILLASVDLDSVRAGASNVEAERSPCGPTARQVAVSGHYLYVTRSSDLYVFDVADPSNPVVVGVYTGTNGMGPLYVAGDILFVGEGNLLDVLDISNPVAPVLIADLALPHWIKTIQVFGQYVYVLEANGVHAIDVANPAAPQLIGSVSFPADMGSMSLTADEIYTCDAANTTCYVVDVSDPAAPTIVETVAHSGGIASAVWRNRLYTVGHALTSFDIGGCSPGCVQELGDVNGSGGVTSLDASLILQSVVGALSFSPLEACRADVNENRSVTAYDAAIVLNAVVGNCFPPVSGNFLTTGRNTGLCPSN